VKEMTQLGIPVFNTPGANANAVKELVIAGMLLGSRRIVDGINHMKVLGASGQAKERVEKDKAMFGGQEISGKTLAVVGLGHIGSITALDAAALGMNVTGKVTTAFTFFFHFTARRLLERLLISLWNHFLYPRTSWFPHISLRLRSRTLYQISSKAPKRYSAV
jgi:hypothetical protein